MFEGDFFKSYRGVFDINTYGSLNWIWTQNHWFKGVVTPLMIAAMYDCGSLVTYLLEQGADLKLKSIPLTALTSIECSYSAEQWAELGEGKKSAISAFKNFDAKVAEVQRAAREAKVLEIMEARAKTDADAKARAAEKKAIEAEKALIEAEKLALAAEKARLEAEKQQQDLARVAAEQEATRLRLLREEEERVRAALPAYEVAVAHAAEEARQQE